MATTPNLGLTTYNTASGSATTFLQFRLALADDFSNMSIIDDFAGGVSASILNLESNSINNVNGNLTAPNFYTCSADLMTTYAVGGMINLKLDTTNGGATTININSIGNNVLKKINSAGSAVDLAAGDLLANRYNMFTYDGSNFVLMNTAVLETTGVTSGSYNQFIVDTYGRITSASFIYISGSISGSGVMSTTAGSVVKHNTSGVTSGSYNQVSVDIYGHVTSASVIAYSSKWDADARPSSPHALNDEFDDSSLSGSWLLFTPGSSLLVTEDATGLVLYSGSVLNRIAGVYKATSGSIFTVWSKIAIDVNHNDDYKSGIILGENMSGSPVTSRLFISGFSGAGDGINFQAEKWTDYENYSGSFAYNDSPYFSSGDLPFALTDYYIRLRVNGAFVNIDISNGGVGWYKIVNNYDIGFTPMHVGLFNRAEGSADNKTRFQFFRYIADTFAVGQTMNGNRVRVTNK